MASNIITGIDIGSSHIRIAVCEYSQREGTFVIRSLTKAPSDGLKNGYVVNSASASASLSSALREAERTAGGRIKRALVSVSGIGLGVASDSNTVAISRADSIVSEFDINRLIEESETRVSERPNVKVLHSIPSEYKVDGRKVLGKPHGYAGNRLELRTTFITCATPHLEALVGAIESNGVEVMDVYALPIAESFVTLSASARNAGTVLVNIGAETVSLMTCEDGLPTSLKVFPIGSSDITHDIALGLRIPLDAAEEMKLSTNSDRSSAKNGKGEKRVNEIINARLSDIFELIDTHLKKIGRSGLLPAGIIFTGEGSRVYGLEELAKRELGLPARIARNSIPEHLSASGLSADRESKSASRARERLERARDGEWSAVLGLCVLGMSRAPEESLGIRVAKQTKSTILGFLKQFLP
ncbi:MAG: cell division protein FtsA [Patescibacteria group bacterium]